MYGYDCNFCSVSNYRLWHTYCSHRLQPENHLQTWTCDSRSWDLLDECFLNGGFYRFEFDGIKQVGQRYRDEQWVGVMTNPKAFFIIVSKTLNRNLFIVSNILEETLCHRKIVSVTSKFCENSRPSDYKIRQIWATGVWTFWFFYEPRGLLIL